MFSYTSNFYQIHTQRFQKKNAKPANTSLDLYWILLSLIFQQNQNQVLKKTWGMLLVLLESPWWIRFYGGDFVIFKFMVWDILNLSVICATENSTKLTNKIFWKDKLVG